MRLEDYFDFQTPTDIRIKGHRIGIETVLYDYIYREKPPEEIQQTYPSLTLEAVYATILFYLRDKKRVTQYVANWLEYCHRSEKEAAANPSPATLRLLKIKAKLDTYPPEERDAALQRILADERAKAAEARTKREVEVG